MKQAGGFTTSDANAYRSITVNGVEITIWKRWATALVKREASGEQLPQLSKESWREVLNYGKDADAKTVRDEISKAEAMMKEAA